MTQPNVWRTMGDKWKATAKCPKCPWTATLTGDTQFEVLEFLIARLSEHMVDIHEEATH